MINFFKDANGKASMKRLAGLLIIISCSTAFLYKAFCGCASISETMLIGFGTLGVGLLGVTIKEQKHGKD